jgi:hypothetical protein
MNEDPKRIWVDNTILCEFDMELCPESDVEYIRADLVDGLVEALEGLLAYSGIIEERDSNCATNKARAALKALESDEIGREME